MLAHGSHYRSRLFGAQFVCYQQDMRNTILPETSNFALAINGLSIVYNGAEGEISIAYCIRGRYTFITVARSPRLPSESLGIHSIIGHIGTALDLMTFVWLLKRFLG